MANSNLMHRPIMRWMKFSWVSLTVGLCAVTLSYVSSLSVEIKFGPQGVAAIKSVADSVAASSSPRSSSPGSSVSKEESSVHTSKITKRQTSAIQAISPRRLFDFITDPSLLITVLHSLEVAYWTFPLGFVLTPVINFFRVPNRRSLEVSSKASSLKSPSRKRRSVIEAKKLSTTYLKLIKAMEAHERSFNNDS